LLFTKEQAATLKTFLREGVISAI